MPRTSQVDAKIKSNAEKLEKVKQRPAYGID